MSVFADAMSDSALPAFLETLGETVVHHPELGEDATNLTGIFEEIDSPQTDQHDDRDGLKRVRIAKLTLAENITITLGKTPSQFQIRDQIWQATAIVAGQGLQTVHLSRREQATQARVPAQPRQ